MLAQRDEPGGGSSWREAFDDSTERLNYRDDRGYRQAVELKDSVQAKQGSKA